MPRIPVAQLKLNMALSKQLFLLREKSVTTTRAGSTMLRVSLADATGSIGGVFFDFPPRLAESLSVGQGVEVTGHVSEFRDQLQVNIERIAPARIVSPEEFLPVARRPLDEMTHEFGELRQSIQDPDLVRLLAAIFDEPATFEAFVRAPGAKYNHHACIGGLLEHTLSVARLVLAACELYPELHRDLALTAALLHDLGKVQAYDPVTFDMTEEGTLWQHLYIGVAQVQQAIDGVPGFNPELRLRLIHALLSHHGKLENGSPVLPMTLEAIVVHYADHLDGDARGALDHLQRSETEGGAFTESSPMHGTRLYRGPDDAPLSTEPRQQPLL
jgi:3'-5' exoribonuclease